ncbi:class I SAM-dependent methyltransferase [Mesorhizobium sp. AR02]|uniref:class I SAM-dependent methyltransferase n=1 Tax=Mesorhizobium sp. AR02 TaxID=2865837 RepID=UPI002160D774|nr:class I SAM-dependent methyltransferase [Mesorhizobium sp. AR02]
MGSAQALALSCEMSVISLPTAPRENGIASTVSIRAGSVQLAALDVIGPHRSKGNEAVCTSPRTFHFIMKSLPSDLQGHTFVDIGSGKSRTLLLASRYPFAAIIGVEFARELVEIARGNIARFRDPSRKCRALSVVEADAAAYEFPEAPLVVYFYNPFSNVTLPWSAISPELRGACAFAQLTRRIKSRTLAVESLADGESGADGYRLVAEIGIFRRTSSR